MSERLEEIKAALAKLDPANPAHWTQAGLPNMDTLKEATGFADLKREEVSAALPGFTRDTGSNDPSNANAPTGEGGAGGFNQPRDLPTAQEIAERVPDPILLLEAAVAAANAKPTYARNGPLMQFVRHFQIEQRNMRDYQARLDAREVRREEQNEEAKRAERSTR